MDWNAVKDVGELVLVGGLGYGIATHVTWIKSEVAKIPTMEAALKKELAEVRGWFDHSAPKTVVTTEGAGGSGSTSDVSRVNTTLGLGKDIETTTTQAPKSGETLVKEWLAPAIDWNLVTAKELEVFYKQQIATAGVSTYLDVNGLITTIPVGAVPSPNFEIQGRVYRGLTTTESERAYVGYNNAEGIDAHYSVDNLGNVTAR